MKTIIAPVDFSQASLNALAFAAELSKRAAARLLVVHIVQNGEDEEEVNKKLQAVESDLKKSFSQEFSCGSSFAHGNLVATIQKIIGAEQPDLIVMGTKGASGLKRILIGSNTVNVIANTRVPV